MKRRSPKNPIKNSSSKVSRKLASQMYVRKNVKGRRHAHRKIYKNWHAGLSVFDEDDSPLSLSPMKKSSPNKNVFKYGILEALEIEEEKKRRKNTSNKQLRQKKQSPEIKAEVHRALKPSSRKEEKQPFVKKVKERKDFKDSKKGGVSRKEESRGETDEKRRQANKRAYDNWICVQKNKSKYIDLRPDDFKGLKEQIMETFGDRILASWSQSDTLKNEVIQFICESRGFNRSGMKKYNC